MAQNQHFIMALDTLNNLSDTLSIVKVKDGKEGEDGQDAHIYQAYSWSQDGTDRFTTQYPNENIFSTKNLVSQSFADVVATKTGFKKTSTRNDTGWATGIMANKEVLTLLKPNTKYSIYYEYKILTRDTQGVKYINDQMGTLLLYSGVSGYNNIALSSGGQGLIAEMQDKKAGDIVKRNATFMTPANFDDPKANYRIIFYTMRGVDSNNTEVLKEAGEFLNIKISEGTALPYTPAPSEDFTNAYPSYVGTYTTFDDVQSTNPADYTWQRFMGNQGKDGEDGISIIGVEVQYAQTTTSTEPTSGWSYTRPTPIPGQYLWTRTRNKFSDGTFGSWATFPTMIGRDAIVVSEIAPANPSIGTLWQKPSDPNVQKWNGTKWENWGIAPENIVADNLVVKDGRFEKLVGAELESGTITNSFDFWDGSLVPNTSAQMWRRGKTTIRNAEVTTLWEDYNKSTGAKVKEGGVIHDSDGTSVYINDPSNFNQTASYRSSGILLRDSRVPSNVSGSFLSYNDLLIYPATPIPAASGWSAYATSGANQPMAVRYGRSVRLTGAFKNNTTLPNTNESYKIGTLPIGLRPSTQEKWLAKGAGTTIFQITVDTNGDILVNYRLGWTGSTFGYLTNNSGDIFNIAGGFAAADI